MWDLYLGSCEATFLERHTGLFQLVLLKNGAQRILFNEPWSEPATRPYAAGVITGSRKISPQPLQHTADAGNP